MKIGGLFSKCLPAQYWFRTMTYKMYYSPLQTPRISSSHPFLHLPPSLCGDMMLLLKDSLFFIYFFNPTRVGGDCVLATLIEPYDLLADALGLETIL